MILMHRNMIFLSLALGVMPALQGAMLTRVTSKLPTVATLKKAITWKRAGALSTLAAFGYIAYKKIAPILLRKYGRTDAQILTEFRNQALESRHEGRPWVHFKDRYTLHWFKRYATREESHYDWSEGTEAPLVRNDGRAIIFAYEIERGYFIDRHFGHHAMN